MQSAMCFLSSSFLQSSLRLKTHITNNFKCSAISFINHKRYLSHQPPTLYSVLGLEPGATDNEIKQAYYNMSKMYHPDKNIGNEAAGIQILKVNEAFEVLGNKAEREKYDKKMFPALDLNKPKKRPFIYEHTEYYDPPMAQKTIYKKPHHINCTWDQYTRHSKGVMKRKQKHLSMKVNFSKNMACKVQTKVFTRK